VAHVPAAIRRPQVVKAAIARMAAEGLNDTSTRAVSGAAGITQSTFHYLFESREGFLRAVIEALTDDVVITLQDSVAAPEDSLTQAIERYVEVLFRGVQENPGRHLLLVELTAHALRRPGLRSLSVWQYGKFEEAISQTLNGLVTGHGLRPLRDGSVSRFVLAVLDGYTLQQLVDDAIPDPRADIQHAVQAIEAAIRRNDEA
jgi:AcrR family transcriptional regulator